MKEIIDEIDKKILAVLIDNSKTQLKKLSKTLRIHPNTLLQRIKKLEHENILMKYSAVVNFTKIDRRMQALMFLDVDMTKGWEEAIRPLAKLPEVVSFLLITGDHDVLIIARVKDEYHLGDLMRRFQATKVVKKTTTHLIVDTYREPYEYNPLRDELRF
ncbi:MAG: Lrp/AsnC family transcriptional regulator [Candidatus Micrarchaeota archaeon]